MFACHIQFAPFALGGSVIARNALSPVSCAASKILLLVLSAKQLSRGASTVTCCKAMGSRRFPVCQVFRTPLFDTLRIARIKNIVRPLVFKRGKRVEITLSEFYQVNFIVQRCVSSDNVT